MKKYSLLVSSFFVFFSFFAFAVDGYWEQVFPKNPPPIRSGHAMASIGERKALMINGDSDDGDDIYVELNDTWLYDYDSNTWTQVYCVTPPNLSHNRMCQISKNRVLWTGGYSTDIQDSGVAQNWVFDLDSMKWFELDLATTPGPRVTHGMEYLREGKAFLYGGKRIGLVYKRYVDTWIAGLDEDEDYDSPYFINWDKVADGEEKTLCPDAEVEYQQHKFARLTDSTILFIPESYIYSKYMIFNNNTNIWYHVKMTDNARITTWAGAYCGITESIALAACGLAGTIGSPLSDSTYLIVYTASDSTVTAHWLNYLTEKPSPRYYSACAKLDDSTAVLFGGYRDPVTLGDMNDTWIFHLTDKTDPRGDIHENIDTIDIRLISNNIYELSVASKGELYDVVGRNITTPSVEAPATPSGKGNCIIDLNGLPVGVYLLKYFHKSNWHVAKLVRY